MAKSTKACPECEWSCNASARACPECGYTFEEETTRKAGHEQCGFEISGTRCPLPGSCSDSIGKGGKRYCAYHDLNRKRDEFGATMLEEIKLNPKKYWPKPGRPYDELVNAVLSAHPEYARGEAETRSQYGARMSKLCLERQSAFEKRAHFANREQRGAPTGKGSDAEQVRAGAGRPPGPKPSVNPAPATSKEEVEAFVEEVEERAARYEVEGIDAAMAHRLGLEDALNERAQDAPKC